MDHKEVGRLWNGNADAWTKLARAGYDVYRDAFNTPAFFEMLPDVRGLTGLDIGCGERHNTRLLAKAAREQALFLAQWQAWRHGVTVNVVGPSEVTYIQSLAEAVELCDHGPAWENRKGFLPQDVAEGVAFLCSEAGRFITGRKLSY